MPLKLPFSKPLGELEGERQGNEGLLSFQGLWRNVNRLQRRSVLSKRPPPSLPVSSHSPGTLVCVCLSETDLSVENGPGTPSCVGIRSWGTWGGVTRLAYFHIH